MDAASLLRQARKRVGLTQRLLARRAGTSHSTLAAYESGSKVPSLPTLTRIVAAAGLRIDFELVSSGPFEDRRRRGQDLLDVLELAELFPVEHSADLEYPLFGPRSR